MSPRLFCILGVFVSIPHRHSKNSNGETFKVEADEVFQFLIGTLKTIPVPVDAQKRQEFQFLIGTLKTFLYSSNKPFRYLVSIPHRHSKNLGIFSSSGIPSCLWFQFLIGTLKTWFLCFYSRNLHTLVSIPHRHSKNWRKQSFLFPYIEVSIPHRHSKNGVKNALHLQRTTCFNSS